MRVLVAEDDEGLRSVLERGLRESGYAVDAVEDGELALRYLDTYEYEVAILDWRMPKVSGLEVTQRLRRRGSALPILMLTARDTARDRVTGLDEGRTTTWSNRSISPNFWPGCGRCSPGRSHAIPRDQGGRPVARLRYPTGQHRFGPTPSDRHRARALGGFDAAFPGNRVPSFDRVGRVERRGGRARVQHP